MTTTKIAETNWYPEKRLVITHISGDLDISDVVQWEKSLNDVMNLIEDNSVFKIFVNLYGFKAVNIEAHKKFRDIIPLLLADYGWKVGYLDLFEEEAKTMTFKTTRGIRCVGAVHSHQDETKITLYAERFSSEKEQFFTDPIQAKSWIENLTIAD